MSSGFEAASGTKPVLAVVLDRDYRTDEEVKAIGAELRIHTSVVHIHKRKELENYLLVPAAIQRSVTRRIADNVARGGKAPAELPDIAALLDKLMEQMKSEVIGQFIARRVRNAKPVVRSSIPQLSMRKPLRSSRRCGEPVNKGSRWFPGKKLVATLNAALQDAVDVNVTSASIIEEMTREEVPCEIVDLIDALDSFRTTY
jgi:hypothetical protein